MWKRYPENCAIWESEAFRLYDLEDESAVKYKNIVSYAEMSFNWKNKQTKETRNMISNQIRPISKYMLTIRAE